MIENLSFLIVVDEYEYKRIEERIRVSIKQGSKVVKYCKSLADAISYLREHTDASRADCITNYFMKSKTFSYFGEVAI